MLRAATPAEVNSAFEAERARLGRAMTVDEIHALDNELALVKERATPIAAATTTDPAWAGPLVRHRK